MSKLNLIVAACAATLACWMSASEAHAQACAWGLPSPVVANEGTYESGFANCSGQDASNGISARVWITAGRWNGATRRSFICQTVNNVGLRVVAQAQNVWTGTFTNLYRRGAAPNCNTQLTTTSSISWTVRQALCQVGFGAGCLPLSSNP